MILDRLISLLIARGEARIGVALDYARHIAATHLRLLMRYNRIFGFLDPNKHAPSDAYHTARLRGAVAADCGSCVIAEINLAKRAGISPAVIEDIVSQNYMALSVEQAATARLTDSVIGLRADNPEARDTLRAAYGDDGLIELSFAMTGASSLPAIKRALGYSTTCDLDVLKGAVRA